MAGLRVLYIDDEPDIREIVEFALGLDPSISVRSCASGEDALALAPAWTPDIILCDVVMPAMDGPTTLARMRRCLETTHTPFVLMTSRAQARAIEQFKSLGAAGVILKPFDPMALADTVRSLLRSTVPAKSRPIEGGLVPDHAGQPPGSPRQPDCSAR
jgi:CheY-like chemotaxis protein